VANCGDATLLVVESFLIVGSYNIVIGGYCKDKNHIETIYILNKKHVFWEKTVKIFKHFDFWKELFINNGNI